MYIKVQFMASVMLTSKELGHLKLNALMPLTDSRTKKKRMMGERER